MRNRLGLLECDVVLALLCVCSQALDLIALVLLLENDLDAYVGWLLPLRAVATDLAASRALRHYTLGLPAESFLGSAVGAAAFVGSGDCAGHGRQVVLARGGIEGTRAGAACQSAL